MAAVQSLSGNPWVFHVDLHVHVVRPIKPTQTLTQTK